MPKTIEQRLYEAYRVGSGIRLSARDVFNLVRDDTIGTRITSQACREANADREGLDRVPIVDRPTWRGFVERMRDE